MPFENRTKLSGFLKAKKDGIHNLLKTAPSANWTTSYHLITGLVRYSDGNCTGNANNYLYFAFLLELILNSSFTSFTFFLIMQGHIHRATHLNS